MDYQQNDNLSELPPQPQPSESAPSSSQLTPPPKETGKRRSGWKVFWGIFIAVSVLANAVLFIMLIGVAALFAAGQKGVFTEEVIQPGPRTNKIAVITLQGIIGDQQSQDVFTQLKAARNDKRVKGLIFRINSPGGTISACDQIYNEILKYRGQTGRPVVSFMQGIAASGGYYTSVACDEIVAEPTAITGSVGVIMGYLVLQELLEGKLGIQPVVIKSGEKKDWPSSFQQPTEEQLSYLRDKVITPAYERFVQVVDSGRASLTLEDVRRLADGSIYGAAEALDEKLVDKIGYLDQAIERVLSLAGIEKAQVVEYRKPFSLTGFLSIRSRNILKIDKTTLYEFGTPQVLYLWSVYQ